MNWDNKAVAKAFNSNVLNDIANGNFAYVEKVAAQHFQLNSPISLEHFFNKAFDFLGNEYPNEYFYKNLISTKILCGKHSLNTATMLSEFRVGSNKADCVILNGQSTCYEIKTDYDSLIRLEDQLSSYLQLFDEVYVVCSTKFIQAVLDLAPKEVGVLRLSERQTFSQIRKATKRKTPLNKKLLMQSLRQHEYKELAERLKGEPVESPNTLIYNECFSIVEQFENLDTLNEYFIDILKKSRKNNAKLINSLPKALTNAAISYRFSKKEAEMLIKYFKEKELLNVLPDLKRQVK